MWILCWHGNKCQFECGFYIGMEINAKFSLDCILAFGMERNVKLSAFSTLAVGMDINGQIEPGSYVYMAKSAKLNVKC